MKEGVIVNRIPEDGHRALMLRFVCPPGLPGLRDHAPGSPQEQREQAQLDSDEHGYKAALLSTLARTRRLAGEGKIRL